LGTQYCFTELVPVLVRTDALAFQPDDYFAVPVDGMYVLGGDQTVAMDTVHDTPLETAMTTAFNAGAVFGGNSAGDAVQSTDMINGYNEDNGPAESLRFNAVQVCFNTGPTDCEGGMPFGFANLITDQHVFEYGRTGRSLNVAVSTDKPVLGMDAATGAVVTDYLHLRDVTGDTLGYVIDPNAYDATKAYGAPNDTLVTSAVAMHLLPRGSGFEFGTMTPSQDGTPVARPDIAGRTYPISTATAAGPLYLAGGIVAHPSKALQDEFVNDAGGAAAHIVVLAAGFAKTGEAQADAKAIAAALEPGVASVAWFALDSRTKNDEAIAAIDDATGIIVTGRDRSLVLDQLAASPAWDAARAAWESGDPLLADDAAAAAAGTTFVAQAPAADVEAGATEDAVGVTLAAGLGLVGGLAVEPRLLPDQLWPQLFQIARASGEAGVAAGIDVGTAIRVDDGLTEAFGDSAVVVVDGRQATWTTGDNGAIGGAWLVLDTFANDMPVVPDARLQLP
jgi:cyanophycinase-like exopeptidase